MDISAGRIMATFAVTCMLACYVFLIYRLMTRKSFYSKGFNVSLAALSVITAAIILAMQSNLVISLGMVGALSIVRFRTAIKDPRDTAYIFWGIAVGICCGVSDYLIAAIGSALIFAFLILFGFIRDNGCIMVIVNCEPAAGEEVEKHMGNLFGGKAALRVHNRAVKTQTEEFIYEISDNLLKKSEKRNGKLVKNLSGIEGVSSVSMVRQDDEINQ